jgi:hypothetical protein
MQRLFIEKTASTPEIHFSPDENIFFIRGKSAPEDVRAMYYPVIEWTRIFVDNIIQGEIKKYSSENAFVMQADLSYFNSSSAKFFFDIFAELKKLLSKNIPVTVEWLYDEDDPEQKEAGMDLAYMLDMKFVYIRKKVLR